MIIKVHIWNEDEFMDSEVEIEINSPSVPRKGETFHLPLDLIAILEKQATSNLKTAQRYSEWYYGESRKSEIIKKRDFKNLTFIDAVFVTNVLYEVLDTNNTAIHIELSKYLET